MDVSLHLFLPFLVRAMAHSLSSVSNRTNHVSDARAFLVGFGGLQEHDLHCAPS
ncbi:hypothetical protein J2W23_002005 [Variovorax boronicumulans]|uniref:hypothetical protein n=1 Tax=Variovorax boronicumulans TaxID=436515 RepID=UPI002785C6C7|nr:hypothetical protein [Variovorax boronicumulans]MDQ0013623.1 hypothetical protein [Variovorax boronicumulans]